MKEQQDQQPNENKSEFPALNETRRRGLDELVPSRYALKVGKIDVLVVSDGVLPIPSKRLATNADPA